MQKLLQAGEKKAEGPPGEPAGEIPEQFRGLDTGGQISEFPPAARKLAWVMLAAVMAWILGMTVWMLANQDKIAAGMK
jgi:hypothetical protein